MATDLRDLARLAESTELAWLRVERVALDLDDTDLLGLAVRADARARRQLAWVRSRLDQAVAGPRTDEAATAAISGGPGDGPPRTDRPRRA